MNRVQVGLDPDLIHMSTFFIFITSFDGFWDNHTNCLTFSSHAFFFWMKMPVEINSVTRLFTGIHFLRGLEVLPQLIRADLLFSLSWSCTSFSIIINSVTRLFTVGRFRSNPTTNKSWYFIFSTMIQHILLNHNLAPLFFSLNLGIDLLNIRSEIL